MTITRRSFATTVAKGGAALAIAPLLTTTACDFASVEADIEKYVPVGLSAISSVVSILEGSGIAISPLVGTTLGLIKIGFADLSAAISQYQSATQGQKPTVLGVISETLTVIEANVQKFWSDLGIPDPQLASLIQGLLGVITTTLAGFLTQLPPATSTAATNAISMKAALAKQLPSTPIKRSAKEFKKAFNQQLGTAYKQHAI